VIKEQVTSRQVWELLENVPDPEIPVISVVDLGVVRDVSTENGLVEVTITPTYSGCPAMQVIELDIVTELAKYGVENPHLKTVINPPWTTDWLSEKGKARLDVPGTLRLLQVYLREA